MHELGLLTGVVTAVSRTAAEHGAERVLAVGLRVGTLSGAIEQVLRTLWPLAVDGSPAQDAELRIEPVQAAVHCQACAADREVDEFFALACPVCTTPTADLVRGREFQVAWVDLDLPDRGPD